MARRCAVLGGGMVGGFIASELAAESDLDVRLYDNDPAVIHRLAGNGSVKFELADLSGAAAVQRCVDGCDIAVGAVPGHLGYNVLRAVIEAGVNAVDISFFPEDALELDGLACERGVTAVVDCGVMPGLGGMLAAQLAAGFEEPQSLRIYVGGLPEQRYWPLDYKAPFSPADVIEEYTRPARVVLGGQIVEREALGNIELLDFPGVGTLEAFSTDGLRTLIRNLPLPLMVEKTLRYPGHAGRIRMLRELGFFSTDPVSAGGVDVAPLKVSEQLLFKAWKLEPGMRELTALRVEVTGVDGGQRLLRRVDLLDRTDELGSSSMARTTGYPAVIAARMLLDGTLQWARWGEPPGGGPGIVCPEWIGLAPCFNQFLDRLGSLCIYLTRAETAL